MIQELRRAGRGESFDEQPMPDLDSEMSKLRNRVIGRVFHGLGLVEQWGSGIQRMIAACGALGIAPPRFEELASRFRVTIHTARISPPALDETDQAIVEVLSDGEGRLTSEIAVVIGLTPRATRPASPGWSRVACYARSGPGRRTRSDATIEPNDLGCPNQAKDL